MAELFRKSSLDTLSTPEQLDRQVKIMRPSAWIIFAAFAVAFVTFVIWGFTYKITNGINMYGVVFTNNNIISCFTERDCLVTDVLVNNGDYVQIGDIIAVVSNDELLSEINDCRYKAESLDKKSAEYITESKRLDGLIESYIASTVIKSNTDGYIQTVKSIGSSLSAGDTIAAIMADSGYNEVVAYVPLQDSNDIELGMTAQVSPVYAPREEYGYMTGVVTAVSETPVSEESIIARMGTLSYVENIIPDGVCVEVRIRLDFDEKSENKYKWSNKKGEGLSVVLGTQCSIIVSADEYLPVEMLLN